jgi:hypothetical protein
MNNMEIALIQNDDEENGNAPRICSVGLAASLYQGYTEETVCKYSTQCSNVKFSVAYWLSGMSENKNFSKHIQGVPLSTEPSISLIILPLMRILQRDLKRAYLVV